MEFTGMVEFEADNAAKRSAARRAPAPAARAGCLAGLLVASVLAGCATVDNPSAPPTPVEPLEVATTELPESDVLNVNIVRFDANVPSDPEFKQVELVFTDVRAAEARYVPYTLRSTLQQSGYWGDVRVVPSRMPGAELEVTGRILDSHGETLEVAVRAQDAAGRVWLDRTYNETINEPRYRISSDNNEDPFQSLYNRIANDLLAARRKLDTTAKREIAEVARLQFAAELAPEVYGPRLETGRNGLISPAPAAGPDPLAGPIDEARRRDARMVDILDQHYSDFHDRMEVPYGDWREASYREMQNLKELRRQANTRKALGALAILGGLFGAFESDSDLGQFASQVAIVGGIYAVASGIDKGRQTSIHIESLRELGQSLERDLEPMVLDVKDKTVRLTGSAEAQYAQWREILGEMVAEQQQLIEQDAAERTSAQAAADTR
ncbi:MAG: hypothetical protein RQ847_01450 [Wenzhouxiangellaceae bacterium]|nr:hypothetical protein [Wenzhouxiangellaceae bacterium]